MTLPNQYDILAMIRAVNDYWIGGHPDGGDYSWNNSVYHIGNMACYHATKDEKYYHHALKWAAKHNWLVWGGQLTRNPDSQCAGTIYLMLNDIEPDSEKIRDIKRNIDAVIEHPRVEDWSWVDTLYMAMPIYAKLGMMHNESAYFNKMYALFVDCLKRRELFDSESLLYRDEKFKYPSFTTPNGKKLFWSRGNGWVFGALARTLDILRKNDPHYKEYLKVLQEMAEALKARQREDGFWNMSLNDPDHLPGPEISGTSLFIYGMAWGVNNGYLDRDAYYPVIARGWNAMASTAVHPNGKLGYCQGGGDRPHPTDYENHSDFGYGVFILAGSEIAKLSSSDRG